MSQAARNITMIPATIQRYSVHNASLTERKRVAGYARVSTDSEEQQTSYEAQVDYYTRYIKGKADEWDFVEVYTDGDTPYGLTPKSPWKANFLAVHGLLFKHRFH